MLSCNWMIQANRRSGRLDTVETEAMCKLKCLVQGKEMMSRTRSPIGTFPSGDLFIDL